MRIISYVILIVRTVYIYAKLSYTIYTSVKKDKNISAIQIRKRILITKINDNWWN